MLVLSEHDLIGLLPPIQIVAAVEAALHAQESGRIVAPKRLHMQWDRNTLFAIPGAVGALGVKYGTRRETFSVGIVGCGIQGAWQAIFACAVRPIREVFCVSRSTVKFEKFATTVNRHAPGIRITQCHDASELLARTALVVTATTSAEPVLPDESNLLVNKHSSVLARLVRRCKSFRIPFIVSPAYSQSIRSMPVKR